MTRHLFDFLTFILILISKKKVWQESLPRYDRIISSGVSFEFMRQ